MTKLSTMNSLRCANEADGKSRVYREKISGTKSAADRPELKKLLIEAKQRTR
jgi:DNA invertase Pin-like site-specific DNA recombinase